MHPDTGNGLPISVLSPDQEKQLYTSAEYIGFPKGQVIHTQEISRITKIYVVTLGTLAFYYEENGHRLLDGELGPKTVWGGLSVLYNNHMAIHTLAAKEDVQVMALDAESFVTLCRENRPFRDVFALELGRCMTRRTFSQVLARRIQDRRFNLPFFNQPVSAIFRPNILTCSRDTSLTDAARKMARQNASAILVKGENNNGIQGILTDADIKSRAVAKELSGNTPVSELSSAPVVTISADAQVFEAFLAMIDEDKRHLAVTGKSGDISGIISEKDLIAAQTRSTFLLIKAVGAARGIKDLEDIHGRLEKMLLDPISNGANADYITRLITAFSDAIIHKVMAFSLEQAGPPPCKFVFLTMGSEGREEQTLISDQDNAIVFEDMDDPEDAARAKSYFDRLARIVCGHLDRAGYRFCEGNNMAQNPDWCQPLSVWKTYFKRWIHAPSPEDLLYSSIFFDFRGTFGDTDLSDALKAYLFRTIGGWSGFLRNMTENAIYFKPPITMFGKFVVDTEGEHKDALDIKLAMLPIIDFARIYALKDGISQTNTLVRLFRIYTRHGLTAKEYRDIIQCYGFLMGLRFRRQITAIMDEKGTPDNYIYPNHLSSLDQIMLKEVFKRIEKLQQKLNIEFTGVA